MNYVAFSFLFISKIRDFVDVTTCLSINHTNTELLKKDKQCKRFQIQPTKYFLCINYVDVVIGSKTF